MKENGELPGHSNRVFCVKFDPYNPNQIASGGWDNTIQLYDIRKKGPVASIYGPHICGEAIDFKDDTFTLLTGSYRQNEVLELFDLRTLKKTRTIEWNGPKAEMPVNEDMEEQKQGEEDRENIDPQLAQKQKEEEEFDRENPAPFIYSCYFNNQNNTVLAAGAGANQVRVFDYDTGNVLCVVSHLPKAILCMGLANQSNDFAFGSIDSKIRIMT
jgi:WD40 repeat protein